MCRRTNKPVIHEERFISNLEMDGDLEAISSSIHPGQETPGSISEEGHSTPAWTLSNDPQAHVSGSQLKCVSLVWILEKEMATHSSVLAWRIPGTGEPGRLPSMVSRRVGHDWSDLAAAAAVWILVSKSKFQYKSTWKSISLWGRNSMMFKSKGSGNQAAKVHIHTLSPWIS